jgi:hypothetical protein
MKQSLEEKQAKLRERSKKRADRARDPKVRKRQQNKEVAELLKLVKRSMKVWEREKMMKSLSAKERALLEDLNAEKVA